MAGDTLATSPKTSSRAKIIGLWIVRIAFALIFTAAAVFKLVGAPQMVSEFDMVGLGQWFRYFTALLELTGAVLLLRPRTVFYGAIALTTVSVGAFFAQVFAIHQDWIHCVVFALILGSIAWAHRGQAR